MVAAKPSLWSRIKAFAVQDTPPGLAACEDCREPYCSQGQWEVCAQRLSKANELKEEE